MNELIGIALVAVGSESVPTVNARELHAFLESGQEFRHWIKARIEQYGFSENQDFVTSDNFIRGGKATDYHVSLDMAKELCMVERNEKGKQARQYFIECERQARAAPRRDPIELLNDPAAMRGLLLTYSEKVISLEAKVEEMRPDVLAFERIAKADGSLPITDTAKTLRIQPKALFRWLQANEWVYRRPGGASLIAYQNRLKAGLLEHKITTVSRPDGTEKVVEQVRVTPKGIAYLAHRLPNVQGDLPLVG